MTFVVLVILAGLWAIVLVPPLLRARNERAADSIGDFHQRLGVLGRTHRPSRRTRSAPARLPAAVPPIPARPGSAPLRPDSAPLRPGPEWSARRRRDVVNVLVTTVALTLALAYLAGGAAAWSLHVLADVMLVAYVGLLLRFGHLQAERAGRVRYLPTGPPSELVLRRTASS